MQKEIKKIFEEIFSHFDINPKIKIKEEEKSENDAQVFSVKIDDEDLNYLIGTRGSSLDALQTLAGLILYRRKDVWTILNVDINGYKEKKEERIEEMVRKYIDKVRFFQKEIELPPMNPWERRLVHMFVKEYSDVHSESSGDGFSRHVVLSNK